MDELTLKKIREKKKKALEKKKEKQDFYGNDPDCWLEKKIDAWNKQKYSMNKGGIASGMRRFNRGGKV